MSEFTLGLVGGFLTYLQANLHERGRYGSFPDAGIAFADILLVVLSLVKSKRSLRVLEQVG